MSAVPQRNDIPFRLNPEEESTHELRFTERRKTLMTACRKLGMLNTSVTDNQNSLDENNSNTRMSVNWCLIQKSGSSFLRRLQKQYQMRPKNKSKRSQNKSDSPTTNHEIIFVRNPYKRLLSGYVDKLFSINPIYWHVFRQIRPSEPCAYDISFPEFVEHILKLDADDKKIDRHFRSANRVCNFCDFSNFKYYIGKVETIMDDMVYISDKFGILRNNETREMLQTYGVNGVEEMMHLNAFNLMNKRIKEANKCGLNMVQCLRVTWLRWKIRGLISYRLPFPAEAERNNITFEVFNALAQRAREMSDPKELAEGQDMALREAYGMLSKSLKKRLRDYFHSDFLMFNYDSTPDFVFGNYRQTDVNISFFLATNSDDKYTVTCSFIYGKNYF